MSNAAQHSQGISVFLAVLRTGSTLAASKALGMSQATVARRVKQLERSLGVTLFEQDTRGSRPTANALQLRDAAMDVDASITRFAEIADDLNRRENHHIIIRGPGPIFDKEVTDIFAEFSKNNPATKIEVRATDRPVRVSEDDTDVGFVFAHSIDDPTIVRRRVGVLKIAFYAAHEYAAVNGLPASEEEIGGHKFIGLVGEDMPREIIDWMNANTRPEQIVSENTNFQTLVAEIRMGKGIGALPALFGDTLMGLVRAFPPPSSLDMPAWLIMSPSAARRPIVRAFTKFFAPRFKRILAEHA